MNFRSLPPGDHQVGVTKHLEVGRERRVSDLQIAGDIAGAYEVLVTEELQNAAAVAVRQGIEDPLFVIS